jgi:hypothetical protein
LTVSDDMAGKVVALLTSVADSLPLYGPYVV